MAANHDTTKPSIIAISSHVARGAVGNRAVVFALETLGFPVWSIPTVLMPWHPGHGPSTRIVPEIAAFRALLYDLADAPWLGEVSGVITGYMGEAAQADAVVALIEAVREQNPECTYVCDPVIGDNGNLYVNRATAAAIRDRLLPLADIVTPNRFELQWLAGKCSGSIAAEASKLSPGTVLTTSAYQGELTGNLLSSPQGYFRVRHRPVADPPNGLGDMTAALFLANRLDSYSIDIALQRTTCSVYTLLKRSKHRNADELTLAADSDCLTDPPLDLTVEWMEQPDE